jgi:TRAP-type mannitol/chloroaromatic compound transport system substrate-binding protein
VVKTACKAGALDMLSEFTARNGEALAQIKEGGTEMRALPDDVLAEFKRITLEVLEEMAEEDEMFGRAYDSFKTYFEQVKAWTEISEHYYLNHR